MNERIERLALAVGSNMKLKTTDRARVLEYAFMKIITAPQHFLARHFLGTPLIGRTLLGQPNLRLLLNAKRTG